MTTEMREAIEGAFAASEAGDSSGSGSPPSPTPTPAESSPPSGDTPPVAAESTPPSGTPPASAPKDTPPTEADVAAAAPKTPEAPKTGGVTPATPREHRVDRPPQSWKGEAKGEWAALPLQTRQEIHRREQQINQALGEIAPMKELATNFSKAAEPFMQRFQEMKVDPIRAFTALANVDYHLATASRGEAARLMAKLITDYQIDIGELDKVLSNAIQSRGAPAATTGANPDLVAQIRNELRQEFAPVLTFAQQQRQAQEAAVQRAEQEVAEALENMRLDPAYPYLDDVQADMADIIELYSRRGVYLSLPEAYTKAVQLNPTTASNLESNSNMTSAQLAHQAALKAKSASVSVNGAPVVTGATTPQGDGTVRGAIEAAFSSHRL